MKRSDRPPNYLIDKIVRHANAIFNNPPGSIRYDEGCRLLKKEIKKLEKYKTA